MSPHATTEELEYRYKKAKDPVERSHFQIVWLLSEGKGTQEVSEVTGYSSGWVRKIARRYNEGGVDGLGDRRHHHRGAKERALLDEAGEEELLWALQEAPLSWAGTRRFHRRGADPRAEYGLSLRGSGRDRALTKTLPSLNRPRV